MKLTEIENGLEIVLILYYMYWLFHL